MLHSFIIFWAPIKLILFLKKISIISSIFLFRYLSLTKIASLSKAISSSTLFIKIQNVCLHFYTSFNLKTYEYLFIEHFVYIVAFISLRCILSPPLSHILFIFFKVVCLSVCLSVSHTVSFSFRFSLMDSWWTFFICCLTQLFLE